MKKEHEILKDMDWTVLQFADLEINNYLDKIIYSKEKALKDK